MEEQEVEVRCPCMDMLEEYYPVIPFVIPLVPMLLIAACLWVFLSRITHSIERQEALLEEMLVDVRRRS
ncbi:MAG: hypothetical protein ACOCX2_03445 [Armatimonadota bacterium]